MAYVVKIWAYQGPDGYPVPNVKHAQKFKDEELAKSAANIAGGYHTEIKKVVTPPDKSVLKNKNKNQAKDNQSWMKGQ